MGLDSCQSVIGGIQNASKGLLLGGDVVVVMCDAVLCPFSAAVGVPTVGGWFVWSVCGDGVVGSGDGHVVWRGDVWCRYV